MSAAPTPRLDFLLRRLVLLAGEVRDLLAAGDWEGALPFQDEFNEGFAQLQRLIETGHSFEPQHMNDLARLRHVHTENEQLASELHRSAGAKIEQLGTVRRISAAYAPLGGSHRQHARYIDGSA